MPSSLPTASLLRNRDFALVWSAGLVSWTGNLAMFVALPVAVYARTDSTLATATAVLGGALPPVLVSQVAGVVADRVDRRRLMLWTNVALAGLTTSYVVLAEVSWWTLVLANLVISSVGQLIGPAEQALLPDLVDDATRLGEAASLNTLNNSLARLIGPAIGGLLFAHFGFWATALLDAATYLVAAGLMAMVSRRRGPTAPAASEQPEPLRVLWAQGAKVVRRNPRLRVLVLLGALVMFGEGYVSALLAPFTKEILGGGAQTLGWMLSAQAVGGSLGAWWATKVVDRHDPLRLLGIAGVISGVLLAGIFNYAYLYPHPCRPSR